MSPSQGLLGAGLGFVGELFGIGGGIVAVPALGVAADRKLTHWVNIQSALTVLGFGMEQATAQGAALVERLHQ